ncbi:MAG TPA: site-specific integrase [Gemmata sp.]
MSQVRIPELKFHKPTNQHYVWWNKARVHMGADPAVAQARYKRWVADLLAGDTAPSVRPATPTNPAAERTVAEVLLAYWKFALTEYAGDTESRRSARHRIWQAIEAVRGRYADVPASRFRGPQLKALRDELVKNRTVINNGRDTGRPITRTYVNYLVACVQRVWKWALSEDLVPADGAATVAALAPLARGKGGREPARVLPPPPGWEEALVELPPVLVAMVRTQALCGMRPQDVCRLRRRELSTTAREKVEIPGTGRFVAARLIDGAPVWFYAPSEHKTSWKGKPRVIAIGPRTQALLTPLLEGLGPDDFVFSPAKALAQVGRGNRFKRQGYSTRYQTRQYAQLVERAIERANRPRVAAGWAADELVPEWTPNQLRHLAATVVGDEIDREHARALLGQSSSDVIDVYLEQQLGKACRAAITCG